MIWMVRRVIVPGLAEVTPSGASRGRHLETWAAGLAFAPLVAWLGNPLWWRDTLPRLAHYLMLSAARRGVLPDIPIFYFGQTYLYTLPWHNAWVLIAITVPAGILLAALAGIGVCRRGRQTRSGPDLFPGAPGDASRSSGCWAHPHTTASGFSSPRSSSWPPWRGGGPSGSPTGSSG